LFSSFLLHVIWEEGWVMECIGEEEERREREREKRGEDEGI
jgi:hypothetical protein